MNVLGNLKLKHSFAIVYSVFTLGFLVYGAWSFVTLNELKVNGPTYQRIAQGKNLVGDIKSPRENIIESYLVTLQMAGATDRFEVIYILLNIESGERVVVKTFLNEPDLTLSSATPVWFGADWLEREVYDMYGIEFKGHPNFKRLLLPDEFASFPLRKDYPQQGRGERHNFPVITRAES